MSGTVKYNPATKTLTLDNATINATGEGRSGISGGIDGLTVQVKGTVNVTAESSYALVFYKSATLTGGGTLNAMGGNCGILVNNTDLTIDGCTVNAKGTRGFMGWYGDVESLTIRNATVTAEGNEYGSICDFKDITLDGCAITQPAGAAFVASLGGVALNGELVTEKVVIEPVIEKYALKIAGTWVTSANCNDLTVIDGVTGTVKYAPATKTLTLEDATITATEDGGIGGEIDGLTVQVKGTVNVTVQDNTALAFYEPTTIEGGGTLNATSHNYTGIYTLKDLTIDGCTVNAKGKYGIKGDYSNTPTIRNATVTAEGNGTEGSICDFKDITLDGCKITQPAGAAFDASLMGVALGGELVSEKVVIEPIEKYALKIAGVQVTSDNCNDLSVIPGVSGTVKYDPDTKTLTLDGANIDSGAEQAIYSIDINVLTIKLIGNNKAIARVTTISTLKPMIITGDGTLDVESTSDCAIFAQKTDLAIYDCTVNAKGAKYGIAGYDGNNGEDLIIHNATVTAEGNECGSIRDIKTLTLDGCAITQPAEAAFDASLKGVALNGQLVKEKVTISLLSASGFVIIDGVNKPVVSYEYINGYGGAFGLRFNLSDDGKEIVQIEGDFYLHIGKDIDLTKKESKHDELDWAVTYATNFFNWDYCHKVFSGSGDPDDNRPVFTTGTLRIDGDPAGMSTVSLKNGRITADTTWGDGKEHTIELICSIALTGIDTVTADASVKKQGIYNLQGVKLNTAFDRLPAGIYIVDGKKVVKR